MISIIISTKDKSNLERIKENISKTIGVDNVEIIGIENPGKRGLAYSYNVGISKAKFDYIIFMHDDVEFRSNNWGNAAINLLKDKKVGLVGVAGSNYMADWGTWIVPGMPFIKGRIIHDREDGKGEQIDLFCQEEGNFDVVVIDGVFMATRKDVLNEIKFDDKIFTGFHFYDIDFSLRVAMKYKVIVTTNILLKHISPGKFDDEWRHYAGSFFKKHKDILPYTNQKLKPDWKNIKQWGYVEI